MNRFPIFIFIYLSNIYYVKIKPNLENNSKFMRKNSEIEYPFKEHKWFKIKSG